MARTARILGAVFGGLLVAGMAGGSLFWLRARNLERAPIPAPPVSVPKADVTVVPPPPTPTSSAPKKESAISTARPIWTWEVLPAGTVKMARGRSPFTSTEPGLVRFDVQSGEALSWHWPREISQYGVDPVPGTEWAEGVGLIVHLPTGHAFRYNGGALLWMGKEGALFQANRPERTALLLMDERFQTKLEVPLPPEAYDAFQWRREPDGSFRFNLRDGKGKVYENRIDLQTGVIVKVPPLPEQGYGLAQTFLFPWDCGGDGTGHQLQVYQDGHLLYSLLDAVAPGWSLFGGTRLLADGQTAVIGTNTGPALLHLADGNVRPVPELAALQSPYLVASPSSPVWVAAVPAGAYGALTYTLRSTQIGQSGPPRSFRLDLAAPPKMAEVRISSDHYWSEDGRYLQVAVDYPGIGGKCGGGPDASDTYLAPVKTKGDWKAPLKVRIKAATSLYVPPDHPEAPKRALAPGELVSVKGVSYQKDQSVFLVSVPEGDGYLIPDPSKMEWVNPAP